MIQKGAECVKQFIMSVLNGIEEVLSLEAKKTDKTGEILMLTFGRVKLGLAERIALQRLGRAKQLGSTGPQLNKVGSFARQVVEHGLAPRQLGHGAAYLGLAELNWSATPLCRRTSRPMYIPSSSWSCIRPSLRPSHVRTRGATRTSWRTPWLRTQLTCPAHLQVLQGSSARSSSLLVLSAYVVSSKHLPDKWPTHAPSTCVMHLTFWWLTRNSLN